jgi:hypothetical protein
MRNRARAHSNVERLRMAIDCMSVATREAMLAGVRANERIIVGAYVDGRGGICPMLAAHRAGARTDFLAFARSWDRFTRANGRARVASRREVAILVSQLQDSLTSANGQELDEAIREHRRLVSAARRTRTLRPRLPDAADPRGEIVARRLRPAGASRRSQRRLTARELLAAAAGSRAPALATASPPA